MLINKDLILLTILARRLTLKTENYILNYLYILIAFVLAISLSYFILPRIILISYKKKLFDEIDDRKIHTQQIPRLGGVCFPLIVLLTLLFVTGVRYAYGNGLEQPDTSNTLLEFVFLFCGMMILFMIGIADDLIGINYKNKLSAQIVAACFFPLSGVYISNLGGIFNIYEISPWIGIPMTVFLVVYITNAINLIDGIDGLASGIAAISLLVTGICFLIIKIYMLALLAFVLLGLLIPFFYFNVFGKAEKCRKLFMGDTGSLTLGYVISFLVIHFCMPAVQSTAYAGESMIIISCSTLLIPCFDVIRVVLVRLRNRKSPFLPDRNHIHHKFLLINFRPHKAMASILLLGTFFIILNITLIYYIDAYILIIGNIGMWIAFHLGMNNRISHHHKLKKKNAKFEKNITTTITLQD